MNTNTNPKSLYEAVTRMNEICDQLDIEDDDEVRANLIDEAIGLADSDAAARREWKSYR